MTNSLVEHDFFGLHNPTNSLAHPPRPRLHRRQSFRGIAQMNPEIVKTVMASAANYASISFSPLPVFHPHPFSRAGGTDKAGETTPMTIFYNGTVSVFDLPHDKAENITKLAMDNNVPKNEGEVVDYSCFNSTQTTAENILQPLDNDGDDSDMPIKRKKSLHRFFEKRKERLISVSPYTNMEHMASGHLQQKA